MKSLLAKRERLITICFVAIAVSLGLLDSLASLHSMGPDGISYLDIGDALSHGHWAQMINRHWSPLYPVLLGIALRVLEPAAYQEFPVVHLVNFLLYLGALAAFSFLLRSFIDYLSDTSRRLNISFPLPETTWIALGYTLFMWSSLRLITVSYVNPDMCLSIFIFWAMALLLRMHARPASWRSYVLLGFVLSFGYFAKAAMFPMAFVFLVLTLAVDGTLRTKTAKTILAAAVFLAVSFPLLYQLSKSAGHLTFGESGRLNYIWIINQVPQYYRQSVTDGSTGKLPYPAKQLFPRPAVYEFDVAARGTYPYWYDPARWYENVRPTFDPKANFRQFIANSYEYYGIFLHLQPALPFAILILVLLCERPRAIATALANCWVLLVVPVCGLGMFALVLVIMRYIGTYVALFLLGVFAIISVPFSREAQRTYSRVILAVVIVMLLQLARTTIGGIASTNTHEFVFWKPSPSDVEWQIADALNRAGVRPGDKVAWIRPRQFDDTKNYWWARLARVQIVAEIPNEDSFWSADGPTRFNAIESLSAANVKAFVLSDIPSSVRLQDFVPIGSTGYYFRLFRDKSAVQN